VKVLDCLSAGWPRAAPPDNGAAVSTLAAARPHLLRWAAAAAGDASEVWSVRQAALVLLGALLSAPAPPPGAVDGGTGDAEGETLLLLVMPALAAAAAENKHSRVRVAALQCLERICRAAQSGPENGGGEAGRWLAGRCREEVRALLRGAAADPQPTVLEAAAKAQEAWLTLLR